MKERDKDREEVTKERKEGRIERKTYRQTKRK